MKNFRFVLTSAVLFATVALTGKSNASIYETINGGFTPGNIFWLAADTGWYWTPASDVDLVGIQTQLRTSSNINNNKTFTTTLYTDRPAAGGTAMGSFTWNGTNFVDGPWLGGSFSSPISLTGGTEYFLGFSGWLPAVPGSDGAGVMMVGPDPSNPLSGNATPGTTLLDGYITTSGTAQFDTAYVPGSWPNTPILRFIAADPSVVPELSSIFSFGIPVGLGIIGIAINSARRRRYST